MHAHPVAGGPLLLFLLGGHLVPFLIVLVLNFLPAVVAFARGHHHPWAILILNLLFGWTVIGWVGCLIWALVGSTGRRLTGPPGSYVGVISPDGLWQWDGRHWVPRSGPAPPPR
jgi:hypothetical protein